LEFFGITSEEITSAAASVKVLIIYRITKIRIIPIAP